LTGDGHAVVTIGCRTSRSGDGGGDCVRASSPNQGDGGGGCYGDGSCCGASGCCGGTDCAVEMVVAVVAASSSKVALVVLSDSFVI